MTLPDPAVEALAKLDVEHLLLPVLVQLAVIIAAARAFGALARKVGQPSVVGEIAAGLILGPSLFGWLFPELFGAVFRPPLDGVPQPLADVTLPKVFTVVAQFGLIFLMFLVGLELEPGHVRANGRAVALIALAGLVVPFALGAALAPLVHPHLEPHPTAGPVPLPGVALFMGLTLAVTAIPVLGRIMIELNITRTRIGAVTLAAAGISDAFTWVLLATAAALVRSNFDASETLRMAGLTVAFALVMWFAVRPLLVAYFARALRANGGRLSATALAVLLVSVLLCAVATNLIGIFAVFGAFLLGAVLSDQHELHRAAHDKLRDLVTSFFVPVFFTYTGLRTDLGALHGTTLWGLGALVVAAAVLGKLVGCGLAARAGGFSWKESALVGALMNARGLMALVAINMGYELGVVPRSLFCMLVVMALATTALTTPLLLWLRKGTELEEPINTSGFLGDGFTAETAGATEEDKRRVLK
ncbi:MAG: sodium:proton antiporter [Planctomycetes bacterium]|nr:sodium:proton antiporter [Planctomycetota bacterium]